MEKKNPGCEPCEQQFEENIDRMVDQVEDYTRRDRQRRREEVDEAFSSDGKTKR